MANNPLRFTRDEFTIVRFGNPITIALGKSCCCSAVNWKTLDLQWGGDSHSHEDCPDYPIFLNSEPSGWQLPGFDDSAWSEAVLNVNHVIWHHIPNAEIFTSPNALNGANLNELDWIARTDFDVGEDGIGTLQINCDDSGTVYLDGVFIGDISGYLSTSSFSVSVTAGTHCLSVRIHNICFSNNWDEDPTMVQPLLIVNGNQIIPAP